jgi:hypothetical protein
MSNIQLVQYMAIGLFIIGTFLLQWTNACYITNCPWGGKRSEIDKFKGFDDEKHQVYQFANNILV